MKPFALVFVSTDYKYYWPFLHQINDYVSTRYLERALNWWTFFSLKDIGVVYENRNKNIVFDRVSIPIAMFYQETYQKAKNISWLNMKISENSEYNVSERPYYPCNCISTSAWMSSGVGGSRTTNLTIMSPRISGFWGSSRPAPKIESAVSLPIASFSLMVNIWSLLPLIEGTWIGWRCPAKV